MKVKPETYKRLVAVDKNNKIINISNMVLRKASSREKQDSNLNKNSICIVCNFRFLEHRLDWSNKIKAICHPFRNDNIFPSNIKTYLFSESDFCDKLITCVDHRMKEWDKLKYDFVYFTLISREGTRSKGLYLLPLINEVSGILKIRGLVINYATRETMKNKGTIYHESLNYIKKRISKFGNLDILHENFSTKEVCAIMKSVRFVLLPSDADASPRLLVESIVRDKPLVVNSSIYGGWKYINCNTGSLFSAPTIEECFNNSYKKDYEYHRSSLINSITEVLSIKENSNISKGFYKEFGFYNSSKKLANIINKISGTDYKLVAFKEWKDQLKKVIKK